MDSTRFEDAVNNLDEFSLSGFTRQYPRRSQGFDESAKSGMRGLERPQFVEECRSVPIMILYVMTDYFFAECWGGLVKSITDIESICQNSLSTCSNATLSINSSVVLSSFASSRR